MNIKTIKGINLEDEIKQLRDFHFEYLPDSKTEGKAKKILYDYRDKLIKDIDKLETEENDDKVTLDILNLISAMIVILMIVQNDKNNLYTGTDFLFLSFLRDKIVKAGVRV